MIIKIYYNLCWIYGKIYEANIFANSVLGKQLYNNTLQLPLRNASLGQEVSTSYVFIGDEAFLLVTNLMRPFPKAHY
jgi:hypothetical protein